MTTATYVLKIDPGAWKAEALDRIMTKFRVKHGFEFHHSLSNHVYVVSGPAGLSLEEFSGPQHSLEAHTAGTSRKKPLAAPGRFHAWQLIVGSVDGPALEAKLRSKFGRTRTGIRLLNAGGEGTSQQQHVLVSSISSGGETLPIRTRELELNRTIEFLLQDQSVTFIDKLDKARTKNRMAMKSAWLGDSLGLQDKADRNFFPVDMGSGQLVTVMDTGLDLGHCFFEGPAPPRYTYDEATYRSSRDRLTLGARGRVAAYVSVKYGDGVHEFESDFQDEPDGHGTHVSGSAAGAPGSACLGQAAEEDRTNSGARILFVDVQNVQQEPDHLLVPPRLTPIMELSYKAGSRVFTNSWGSNGPFYTSYALELDRFAWLHDDYVVLFAAGNEGDAGDHYTLSSPGVAKNVISVGATMNVHESFLQTEPSFWPRRKYSFSEDHVRNNYEVYSHENLISFSSRGPTWGGRIGPLVVAPGAFVLSSRARGRDASELLFMPGTSMATPMTTRAVTALVHRLRTFHGVQNPSSALIRALLVASAQDLRGGVADLFRDKKTGRLEASLRAAKLGYMEQGFGRVFLRSFWQEGGSSGFKDRLRLRSFERPRATCFRVRATGPVSVALSWTDPPGFIFSGDQNVLVNDLDLRVQGWRKGGDRGEDPDFVLLGNHGRTQDRLNNNERVRFEGFEDDLIRVLVSTSGAITNPQEIPGQFGAKIDEQKYALAWFGGQLEELETCPGSAECSLYDPEFECTAAGGVLGVHPCDRDLLHWDESQCLPVTKDGRAVCPKGEAGDVSCACYAHLPCAEAVENLHGFAVCAEDGRLASCQGLDSIFESAARSREQREAYAAFRTSALVATSFIEDQQASHSGTTLVLTILGAFFIALVVSMITDWGVREESTRTVNKDGNGKKGI